MQCAAVIAGPGNGCCRQLILYVEKMLQEKRGKVNENNDFVNGAAGKESRNRKVRVKANENAADDIV